MPSTTRHCAEVLPTLGRLLLRANHTAGSRIAQEPATKRLSGCLISQFSCLPIFGIHPLEPGTVRKSPGLPIAFSTLRKQALSIAHGPGRCAFLSYNEAGRVVKRAASS